MTGERGTGIAELGGASVKGATEEDDDGAQAGVGMPPMRSSWWRSALILSCSRLMTFRTDTMSNDDDDQVEVPLGNGEPANHFPLRSRCMVHKLGALLKLLSEDKKAAITSFGFGGLMEAAIYSLRTKMVEDLISCLDVDTGELSVHGRKLHMAHAHAGYLLGLPSRGRDVDGLISQADAHENFSIVRTSLTPSALYAELIQMPDGEDFKRRLLLYIVGSIIRPTGNVHISTSYPSLLHRLDEIKDMNWAKFAFEGVLAALFYLEHLAIGIIHQPIIERETPRVSFWTDARITRAMKHVIHRGGVGAHTVDMFTPSDHTARVEGQDVNDLKSQLDALQREVIILKSHVTLSLVDVRREMSDMVDGALAGVRANLESQGKEIACIR
ncbi:hypothetical protein J5N97_012774 [Dioscorea zingiberensis]|uniref:Uncharacterized protein n=1 Tax=Dioscorea zingiberensis TaxID=325984 RepID=A0A9D5CPN1_9LILI|nr:hypothetical protein J5N97_012774 [Dioscorea zingiberensis]